MFKRKFAALLLLGSRLCALAALTALLVWALGSLLSDRFYWSQFPAYIPTAIPAAASTATMIIAWALHLLRRRMVPAPRGPRLLWLATLLVAACISYFALIECRIHRLISRDTLQAAAPRPGGLRILFWNASSKPDADLPATMTLVPSDLAITANPTWQRPHSDAIAAFGDCSYLSAGPFVVLSRSPILRWGATSLGLVGRQQVSVGAGEFETLPRGNLDAGHALWMELDTRQSLGRPIVVWVLDLPSDQRAGRWSNASTVALKLHDWPGPAIIPDARGGIVATEPASGFPPPDLVLGDFNTPRGSASLALLAPGLIDVYSQGGAGYAATFPRKHPLVHIDLMLAAPWLRGRDYRIIDPGHGTHRMQWARLEAR